jgi:hypothetical protein
MINEDSDTQAVVWVASPGHEPFLSYRVERKEIHPNLFRKIGISSISEQRTDLWGSRIYEQ